jgi:hypothetical protein
MLSKNRFGGGLRKTRFWFHIALRLADSGLSVLDRDLTWFGMTKPDFCQAHIKPVSSGRRAIRNQNWASRGPPRSHGSTALYKSQARVLKNPRPRGQGVQRGSGRCAGNRGRRERAAKPTRPPAPDRPQGVPARGAMDGDSWVAGRGPGAAASPGG